LKVNSGMCDPDQIAQELGYEGWYDLSRLEGVDQQIANSQGKRSYRFQRDESLGRYVWKPDKIRVARRLLSARAEVEDEAFEKVLTGYLQRLRPLDEEWQRRAVEIVESFLKRHTGTDFTSEEAFAEALLGELEREYGIIFESGRVKDEIEETIEEAYKYFRLKDTAALAEIITDLSLVEADTVSMQFIKRVDSMYFSKFINNRDMRDSLLNFFKEEYLQRGTGLFGPGTQDLEAFRDLFADRLETLSDSQIRRIIATSVQRIRNWANFRSYHQAGIEVVKVHEVMDADTCSICRPLHGTVIRVEKAVEWIDTFTAMEPEEYGEWLRENSIDAKYVETLVQELGGEQKAMDYLVNSGICGPPFHPNCRGRTVRERITATEKALWAKIRKAA